VQKASEQRQRLVLWAQPVVLVLALALERAAEMLPLMALLAKGIHQMLLDCSVPHPEGRKQHCLASGAAAQRHCSRQRLPLPHN